MTLPPLSAALVPRRLMRTVPLVLLFACAATGLTAQESASFDVSFAGIRAGTLAYEGSESGGTYQTRGSARATGLAGVVFDTQVDTAANGRVDGNRYRPSHYSEVTRDDDTVRRRFTYSGGVPSISRTPPRDKPQRHAAPASAQTGTVDPMTAAFAILRDRSDALACTLDIAVFDGARRSQIALNRPRRDGDVLICEGRYSRVAGFSPDEMAERKVWPLEMRYSRNGDLWQVEQLTFPTSFGNARIRRR